MTTLASASVLEDIKDGRLLTVEIDGSGDTRHSWDKGDPVSVQAARDLFNTLTGKGHRAYSVTKSGKQDRQMREFDPDAEAIIFAPALQGG